MAKQTSKKSQVAKAEAKEQAAQQEVETKEPATPVGEQTETETPEAKAAREQREAKLAEVKQLVNHKAEYVPAEDYEFHPAVVVGGVIDNKGNVLVALRDAETNKRITKKYGSKLLRIFDELAEVKVRTRAKKEREDITDEVIAKHRELIGFPCTINEIEGRVRGIQIDKRTKQIYLTIHQIDGQKCHTKIDNANFSVLEADSETETIRTKYFELLEQRANGKKSTPEGQVAMCGAGFVKAYKQLVEAGKIEETENLVAIIEEICETAKKLNQANNGNGEQENAE